MPQSRVKQLACLGVPPDAVVVAPGGPAVLRRGRLLARARCLVQCDSVAVFESGYDHVLLLCMVVVITVTECIHAHTYVAYTRT